MADILDECRKAAKTLDSFNRIPIVPDLARTDPALIAILTKCAIEIERLRRANRSLAARNILLMMLLAAAVCGGFMAVFLRS